MDEELTIRIVPEPTQGNMLRLTINIDRYGYPEIGYQKVLPVDEFNSHFDQIWEQARIEIKAFGKNPNANKALTSPADLP